MDKGQSDGSKTLENIKKIAYDEFMTKGFRKASLRQIVKKAGVTTGAFYGYFDSKEALFTDLIDDHIEKIMTIMDNNISKYIVRVESDNFFSVSEEEAEEIRQALREIYAHRDVMKFLISSADGTRYGNFLERIAARRVSYYCGYDDDALYTQSHHLNRHLLYHIILEMYYAFCELAVLDLTDNEFVENALGLWNFYAMGCAYLAGVKSPLIEVKG
jgi:AcrR family transcriptional regulator